ncbi:protein NYNRIN-like [Hoplias malabaricus]|uniref:protein NYNRIN-like n=1 Tax=Hoplias malabaricus TaxID=27720 RepID=UPI00346294A6
MHTQTCDTQLDLKDEPLTNPDLVLFVDGSASRDRHGVNKVGCAVVTASEVLVAKPLPSTYSAQAAELVALIEACKLAEDIQSSATAAEIRRWKQDKCSLTPQGWMHAPTNKPCLPKAYARGLIKIVHGRSHMSKGGIVDTLRKQWYAPGLTNLTQKFCSQCLICAQHSAKAAHAQTSTAGHPPATEPFQHWQIDFVELTQAEGKKYMLVCVCMFSKWTEAFPTGKQDAQAVTKMLLREIIPRWGLPTRISSDNGTPFVQRGLIDLTKHLGIDMRKHCSYHPASAGAVERMNGTLKNGLAKMHQDTGLSWVKCLPLVLWQMRTRPQPKTGLSAFEIVFGRPPNIGVGPPLQDQVLLSDTLVAYCSKL